MPTFYLPPPMRGSNRCPGSNVPGAPCPKQQPSSAARHIEGNLNPLSADAAGNATMAITAKSIVQTTRVTRPVNYGARSISLSEATRLRLDPRTPSRGLPQEERVWAVCKLLQALRTPNLLRQRRESAPLDRDGVEESIETDFPSGASPSRVRGLLEVWKLPRLVRAQGKWGQH